MIGLTAVFGVAAFWALDEVRWPEAALVGLPAMLGTLAGTWAQQRIPSRFVVLLFAAFLVALLADALADVTLRRLFAGLLLVTAVQLAVSELRGGRGAKEEAPIT